MAYCYDNLKLEKGMYHEAGGPSLRCWRAGPLGAVPGHRPGGLDAFQRQLKPL